MDLKLISIGLDEPTVVECEINGKIERLESRGLDIASLVAFWRKCFDLDGLLFEKITLHCKLKDFNAMGQRTLATCHNVRELLSEQGVECVIDDEWFKERDEKLKACNEKQAELEAEIERRAVEEFAQKIKDSVADYLYKTNFDGHKDNVVDMFELCEIVDGAVKGYENDFSKY